MRLRFDADLPHQRRAIAAVTDVFADQPLVSLRDATVDVGGVPVVGNGDGLSVPALADRLRAVQAREGVPTIDAVPDGVLQIAVEMETGTGKTYTYLRTLLELSRAHGWRKFVVVVPSVAIREGVLKTLQVTREHFRGLYPDVPYRFFVYDSSRLGQVAAFARSASTEIMVLTIDAFNKTTNVLRQPSDAFSGQAPLRLVAATRPVVILDEPQNMESALRRAALADLAPLCMLRYGATHRHSYTLVHRLTPARAHQEGLVKRIEVVPAPPSTDRESLFAAQIRTTIDSHLDRQAELRRRGIKVLSLFFLDRVASYTDDNGLVRVLFDHFYEEAIRARGGGHPPAPRVRAAYFAHTRRGGRTRAVDSRSGDSVGDAEAYALIMRDKERLLSLDEPVAFLFTHSALREGWDNPNVFQICTLNEARSTLRKRQEIGRGVRLCVDVHGRRVLDPEVNVLRVIANASYEAWVAELQAEDDPALEAQARAPVPRRAGTGPGRPTRPITVPTPRQDIDAEALVAATVRRIDAELATWTDRPDHGGPLPDLVELCRTLLRRHHPRLVLTRRTIVRVLERVRPRAVLVSQPVRLAHLVADALAREVLTRAPSQHAGGTTDEGIDRQQ